MTAPTLNHLSLSQTVGVGWGRKEQSAKGFTHLPQQLGLSDAHAQQ